MNFDEFVSLITSKHFMFLYRRIKKLALLSTSCNDSIIFILSQPGQIEIPKRDLDWGSSEGGIIEINRVVIQTDYHYGVITLYILVR